jgi:hypothetical protein
MNVYYSNNVYQKILGRLFRSSQTVKNVARRRRGEGWKNLSEHMVPH